MHDIVHAVIGILEFQCHGAHDMMHIGCMGFERVGGGFDLFIGVEVYIIGKVG